MILIDVLSINKLKKHYRVLIDVKGRFITQEISAKQAQFKLCRIVKRSMGKNRIPYIVTHDGRTIRYPAPDLNVLDTVKLNLKTGEFVGTYRFESGKLFLSFLIVQATLLTSLVETISVVLESSLIVSVTEEVSTLSMLRMPTARSLPLDSLTFS